jgi:ABC-type branched-subunit amino acid transport system substrate-binding protein
MESFGYRRLGSCVLLLVCLLGLTHCGTFVEGRRGPSATPRPPGQDAAERVFREAEQAYRQKDYVRARVLYKAVIADYPQTTLVADASFRLAELAYYEGQYEAAQQAFQEFLRRFPQSPLAPDAAHLQGLSLLHLKRTPEARGVLEQAQRQFPGPRHQPYFALALAKVSAAEGQPLRAIDEIHALLARRDVPDDVKQQARELGIDLIDHQLTAADLTTLKERWPLEFPADYILLRQAREAWEQKRADQAAAAAKEFLTKFPDHPQAAQMRSLLSTIEQAYTVSVDPHKIGVLLPLSGPRRRGWVSEVGQSALQGIQVAFAREGFSPLKLEVRDSKADVSTAAAAIDELVTVHHVIAIVGPLLNETAEAAARKALQYRVPLLIPGAPSLAFPSDNPYVLRTSMTNRLEARRLAEYAVSTLGLRRIAIAHPNDQAGRELADLFEQRVLELGGEIVARAGYAPNEVDFTAVMRQLGGQTDDELKQASRASQGDPSARTMAEIRNTPERFPYEALYLPRSFERLQFLGPALALYNITGITLLGESGWNHPELTRRAGSLVEGAVFMDGFFAGSSDARVQDFVRSYRAMFDADPDLVAAQSYDAMMMLLQVLKRRPQTREEVMTALRNLHDFRGATGRASVLPTGDLDKRLFALTVRRGRIVQLN